MWGVILRFCHHPRLGFENHNNLCGNFLIDKNSLFDGINIGKLNLCVKTKAITRYGLAELNQADGIGVTFWNN